MHFKSCIARTARGPDGFAALPERACLVLRCVLPDYNELWSIHREAPEFTEQSTEQEILVTGIKVG